MGRDYILIRCRQPPQISIHSPRMGRDTDFIYIGCIPVHFNPLSPHGERQLEQQAIDTDNAFQSTLPAWGETFLRPMHILVFTISIHSPRMGRDINAHTSPTKGQYFNPLSPHGERRARRLSPPDGMDISIHSPRMGRDDLAIEKSLELDNFNPLSPHGERPDRRSGGADQPSDFNPLSPHGERRGVRYFLSISFANFNPLSPHGERPTRRIKK